MNNLFGNPTLVGLQVRLDRPVDRERPCCRNICVIGAGKGPHAGELICTGCGGPGCLTQLRAMDRGRGAQFGAPNGPIIVRRTHTYEEEVPDTETVSH